MFSKLNTFFVCLPYLSQTTLVKYFLYEARHSGYSLTCVGMWEKYMYTTVKWGTGKTRESTWSWELSSFLLCGNIKNTLLSFLLFACKFHKYCWIILDQKIYFFVISKQIAFIIIKKGFTFKYCFATPIRVNSSDLHTVYVLCMYIVRACTVRNVYCGNYVQEILHLFLFVFLKD